MKSVPAKPHDKFILITNLSHVFFRQMRLNASALVLQEYDGRRQVRGFGTDSSLPVFDLDVGSLEHKLTPGRRNAAGLYSEACLNFPGGPKFTLSLADASGPLDIQTFEAAQEERIALKVWDQLCFRAANYWRGPNMPLPAWSPKEAVLQVYHSKGFVLTPTLKEKV